MKPQYRRVIFCVCLLVGLYAISANDFEGCDFPHVSPFYSGLESWRPGSTVHVFIDSRFTNETVRSQLAQGLLDWSLWSENFPYGDCSGVTFYGFDTMDMSGIGRGDPPPANTVWVISQTPDDGNISDSQFLRSTDVQHRIIGHKIRINPNAERRTICILDFLHCA